MPSLWSRHSYKNSGIKEISTFLNCISIICNDYLGDTLWFSHSYKNSGIKETSIYIKYNISISADQLTEMIVLGDTISST